MDQTYIDLLWLNKTAIIGHEDHLVAIDGCPDTVLEA